MAWPYLHLGSEQLEQIIDLAIDKKIAGYEKMMELQKAKHDLNTFYMQMLMVRKKPFGSKLQQHIINYLPTERQPSIISSACNGNIERIFSQASTPTRKRLIWTLENLARHYQKTRDQFTQELKKTIKRMKKERF